MPAWVRFARSGLFDDVWYSALTGRGFPHRRAAARHFKEYGMPRLLSPNPFLFPAFLPNRVRHNTYLSGDLPRLMGYLRSSAAYPRALSPLYQASRGDIAVDPRLPGGPMGTFLSTAEATTYLPVPAQNLGPAPQLGAARDALLDFARALHSEAEWAPIAPEPTPGLASLVLPLGPNPAPMVSAIRSALTHACRGSDHSLEILVLDPGQPWHVGAEVLAWFLTDPRVRLSRHPGLDPVPLSRAGVRLASGQYVATASQPFDSRTPWLTACLRALDPETTGSDPRHPTAHSASPVVLDADDTLLEYGAPAGGADLLGHPVEDLAGLSEFRGNRRNNLVTVSRHPNFLSPPACQVLPRLSRGLRHRWPTDAVVSLASRTATPSPSGPPPTPPRTPETGLRWGLTNPAPPGLRGDLWGDTSLAEALAAALRRRGACPVLHRRLDPDRSGMRPIPQRRDLDDVQLVLRGLYRTAPVPGRLNVLWVYSHPADVTAEELREFDLVFAASPAWARRTTQETGVPVQTLLQAVDTTRLPDPGLATGTDPRPVFVGSTHPGRPRPLVEQALSLRLPLVLRGPGWRTRVGPAEREAGVVADAGVAPAELLQVYRRHGLVLADHWADMAREGFVANRLFDAVASGARVICDPFWDPESPPASGREDELDSLFGGAVRVAEDPDRLRALLEQPDRHFPAADEMAQIAARVAEEHSYDVRARTLSDAVAELLRARGSDPRSRDGQPGRREY